MSMIERIIVLLNNANITASKLTSDLELSNSAITDWKKGKGKPSTEAVIKISKYFNITADWLLTGEGEMYKQTIDIQPKTYSNEELNIEEEILLETYKNSDRQTKKEILTFVASKTFNFKSPKSKLSIYENGETSTTKEKMLATQKIAC